MTDVLTVFIGQQIAGHVSRSRGGNLRFDYDEDYRAGRAPIPLSVSMPVQVQSHSDGAVKPWLSGLLPDNDAVIRRWAQEFGVRASSPFSLLSTPIGEDCAGAARFVKPDRVQQHLEGEGNVEWLTEIEVAERLRELTADSTAWLGATFAGQFSLAGAQAKTALLYSDGRWGVPSGAVPTTHILKPAVAGLDDHDLNEHLCMDAARRAGLVVARTGIVRFEDQSAIVVERYDRVAGDGWYERVHQEDLCQALSVPPAQKYQSDGGPSPADVVGLMRRTMTARKADDDALRFIDALAFNWFIGGTDAHAKNYSLLLGSGEVRLAPLYDVASALPYGRHERRLRMAMKLGGSYDVYPRRSPWSRVARDLDVDAGFILDRVRGLGGQLPDAFADAAADDDVQCLDSQLPRRLVDAIAERVGRCIEVMNADA